MGTLHDSAFGTLLRSYRLAAGLSQERLAERAGLSLRGISDLERGVRTTPRLETVRMLAEGLELAPDARDTLLRAARPVKRADPPDASDAHPEHTMSRLPVPPTPLVGRARDLASLVGMIASGDPRLITITGPGGVGKTRLAQEVALRLQGEFADGACFVSLVALPDAKLVLPAIANALAVTERTNESLQMALERFLTGKRLLLVLDNVECVLDAGAEVASLLSVSEELRVLATSRMPLQLRGERLFPLSPLGVPGPHRSYTVAELDNYGAIQLLVTRIRDVRPDFSLDEGNAQAIADICRRLDGLPLALELAAVRARLLTPSALLERLERRLPLLTGGPRDLPERHQTLRATISWGYDLLPPQEQALFRRLGAITDGWTLEVAEIAVSDDASQNVVEQLNLLLNASLIQAAQGIDGEPRYTMLETVREFAQEQLESSGEAEAIRRRFAGYYLELGESGTADISDAAQRRREARLTAEQGNIRTTLGWLKDQGLNSEGVRLITALGGFWNLHGANAEGRAWMEVFLAQSAPNDMSVTVRIAALRWLGAFAGLEDDRAIAKAMLRETIALARRERNTRALYATLNSMGQTLLTDGEIPESVHYLTEGLALARAERDQKEVATLLAYLAYALGHQGNLEQAETFAAESLALAGSYGAPTGFEATIATLYQGWLAIMAANDDLAVTRFESAVTLGGGVNQVVQSPALAGMAEVALAQGRVDEAATALEEGFIKGWEGGFRLSMVANLQGLVRVAIRRSDLVHAARLTGLLERFGSTLLALPPIVVGRYNSDVTQMRYTMGEDRFEVEKRQGKELRLADIVAEVKAGRETPFPSPET